MKETLDEETISLVDHYFSALNLLSDKAKLYLINKLTASLMESADKTEEAKENEKDEAFRKLAGVWRDDPESEVMEDAILTGRRSIR